MRRMYKPIIRNSIMTGLDKVMSFSCDLPQACVSGCDLNNLVSKKGLLLEFLGFRFTMLWITINYLTIQDFLDFH